MGHIKEPKGVDFIIASEPLTDKARQEISAFIRNYKAKQSASKQPKKTPSKLKKVVHI